MNRTTRILLPAVLCALFLSGIAANGPRRASAQETPEAFIRSAAQSDEWQLLKVGTKAPNFTLPTIDGQKVTLTSTLKTKKAVLVNFWFYD